MLEKLYVPLVISNSIALTVIITYLILTFYHQPHRRMSILGLLFDILAIFAILLTVSIEYVNYVIIGVTCTVTYCIVGLALLSDVHISFIEDTDRYINLPLVSLIFITTCVWFLYGYMTDDIYIEIANGMGITVSFFLIILKLILPIRSKANTEKAKDEDEQKRLV